MPNASHIRLAKTATRLLKSHGRKFYLIGEVNSGTEREPIAEKIENEITGVFTKFSKSEIDGSTIMPYDKKVIIDSSFVPTVDMKLKDGNELYSIITAEEVKPGDVSIVYKLQVRK